MNVFIVLILLLVFFLLMQQGMLFFAFLALIAAVLALFSDMSAKRPRPGAAAGGGVSIEGGNIPEMMKIRVQPDWGGQKDGEEKAGRRIGSFFNFFGKTIGWLGRGFKKKGEK